MRSFDVEGVMMRAMMVAGSGPVVLWFHELACYCTR